MSASCRVMIVEHDPDLSDLYSEVLQRAGMDVRRTRDAQDCVTVLDEWQADALVLDLDLHGHSGFEILHELQSYDDLSKLPVIAISNVQPEHFPLSESAWQAYGVHHVLYRPTTRPQQLLSLIKNLVQASA